MNEWIWGLISCAIIGSLTVYNIFKPVEDPPVDY